jgi:uncharacterized RDD family membrane protein YckC
MAAQWYYADSNGQQVGPISADELRAAVRTGAANAATLAWRDGLADWKPLAQLAAELQLEFGAATTSSPAPQPSSAPASANPYSAPEAAELDVRSHAGEVIYAGFWSRFAARVIDHFVVSVPVTFASAFLVGAVAASSKGAPFDDNSMLFAVMMFYVLPLAANFVYFSAMHSSSLQATLGKMAFGIKVTDAEGNRLGFGQAALRWFAALVSWLTLCLGFIMAGFTDRKRALHDMLANTLVVDKWAFTPTPERQQRGLSGCLIVFLVVVALGAVAIVGSIAALSVGQYQKYLGM